MSKVTGNVSDNQQSILTDKQADRDTYGETRNRM